MFAYEFMRHAFLAAGLVAVLAGVSGYFLVLRGQSFASHALAHLGFTGATGAVLLGLPPLGGLIAATLIGGLGMGWLDEAAAGRDVAIGMVLAVALGLGLLFLHFFTAYATQATALLFGNVLGIDGGTLATLAGVAAASLGAMALIARPLLFASLQPEAAAARGVSNRLVSVLFLLVVALVTACCAQIVGVLLVFTLMVGPAAAAQAACRRFGPGIALSVLFALGEAWGGLALAYATDWPTSFWISALSGLTYGMAVLLGGRDFKAAWRPGRPAAVAG